MRALLLLFFMSALGHWGWSASLDTLIVEAIAIDRETKEILTEAVIKYESQPYGSKIGIRNTPSCTFEMLAEEVYRVRVEAPGYLPSSVTIDYKNFIGAGRIVEEIEMTPNAKGQIMRLETLIFPQGESTITASSYEELDKLVQMLRENPTMVIQLEGHTDFRGDDKLNMKLSKDRVEATQEYLVSKGISKNRIKTKAFGGSQPLSRTNDAEAARLNRRVEVRILED